MSLKDTNYLIGLIVTGLIFGATSVKFLHLPIWLTFVCSIIISVIVSIIILSNCVDTVHYTYQPGRRDPETGFIETIKIPHTIYKNWYIPIMDMIIIHFPITAIIGALVCNI